MPPRSRGNLITSLRLYQQTAITYELTIDGLHTYYVEAGTTPILVHNCGNGSGSSAQSPGTTARLQGHVDRAVADYGTGAISMSDSQAEAAAVYPWLKPVYRGQVIDAAVKSAVRADPSLGHLWTSRAGEFGPDFHDIGTNTWWDVTTPGQWNAHVRSYSSTFGNGIGLFTR